MDEKMTSKAFQLAVLTAFLTLNVQAQSNDEHASELEPNTNKTRTYILTSKLKDTESDIDNETIKQEFGRSQALIEQLSYGQHKLELVGIQALPRAPYTRQQVKAWADTSSMLSGSFAQDGGDVFRGECNLASQSLKAQKYLDNLSEDYKQVYGISISKLDLSFVKQYMPTTACKEMGFGDIWMRSIELPEDIDLSSIDSLVFTPIDDEFHGGGYQSGLPYVNFKNSEAFNRKNEEHIHRVTFVLTGLTPYGLTPHNMNSSYLESKGDWDNASVELAEYLNEKAYAQSEYSRVLSHEILHALGIGTHDDGLDFYTDSALVAKTNMEPVTNHALSYGDYFSILGRSHFAIGLSPTQREYLGWLEGRVTNIHEGDNLYSIAPLSSKTGKVVAKVKINNLPKPGYLYLSYESNKDEYAGLNWQPLSENTKGLILRFAEDNGIDEFSDDGRANLTTSIVLDPDGDVKNESFALQEGQSFVLGNVTISVESVSAEKVDFRVVY